MYKHGLVNNQTGFLHLVLILVGALLIGGLLIGKVANGAKPGDSFYALDQTFEKAKLLVTFGDENKIREYTKLSSEREDEIMALVDENADQALIDEAVSNYLDSQDHILKMVSSLPEDAKARVTSEVAQKFSTQNQEFIQVISQLDTNEQAKLLDLLDKSQQNYSQLTKNLSASDLRKIEQEAEAQIRNFSDLLKKIGL